MRDLANKTADPSRTTRPDQGLVRVYVWDLVVRVCHWLVALSIFVLAFTGYYLGKPFVAVPGEAGESFVMGNFRAVHYAAAAVFSLAALVRIYWAFLGSLPARWPNYLPVTPRRIEESKESLAFYLLLRDRYPPVLGHNPLAGLAYVVVYGLLVVMIVTGLGIYAASAHHASPFRLFDFLPDWLGGLQTLRWVHHGVMWLILGFFVHHVYSALLASHVEKNGTLESIFSGFKWVRRDEVDE